MAYSIRSLADLGTQARQYFTQSVPGAIASVWPNSFTVIGKVLALLGFEHEQRRSWLFRQMFASTADEVWLARHGFELGLAQQPASFAVGTISVTVASGTSIPAGISFVRADGLTFTSVAAETSTGTSLSLPVEADLAGELGNTDPSTILTLDPAVAIVGLAGSAQATVDAAGLAGGADLELLETFRARVLARKRQPPQGGSVADFVEWTHEALSTVQDVFVDSFVPNAGTVWVAFTVSDQANGIPTAGQVAVVQAYLSDPVRRPVTARVTAVAPVPVAIAVTVANLSPNTADVQASVQAELAAEFLDRAQPGLPSVGAVFYRSWIDEAISRATGENSHDLTLPAADVTLTAPQLPILGTVTFV